MKLKRRFKYYLIRLFRLNAGPHYIAFGLILGFIPNWFPTFGLGPLLSIALAKLFRANLVAAGIGGILGAPIWPLLFLLNYKMGSLFFSEPSKVNNLDDIQYRDAVDETVESFHSGSFLYLSGTIINVLLSSLLFYIIIFILIKKYRINILSRLKHWYS